ncbi:hypothetical protein [Nitrospirillum iridis]|uniref:Uncharacterized protein n=1 Tax=Nitrospirillum iridis TaxID=765888 RepID=A0A7X0AZ88_9PROT|nr:hypothetical protein [Nitrospirillum iridis]MBB6251406.1 hypothetical protein [Nitrospirillum iridis]
MSRLEIQTMMYWRHAHLASHEHSFLLAIRGFDYLDKLAGAASVTPRLRAAAANHIGVAARGRGFGNALGLEKAALEKAQRVACGAPRAI